jgi:predicted enzyme related to lactoylglutathione lyase
MPASAEGSVRPKQEVAVGKDWARPVVHWEIVARDPNRQASFYRDLFNWEIGDGPMPPISPGIGGPEPGPAGHIREGERGVVLYVQVRELRASLERVRELGGTVTLEPVDVPGGPTVAGVTDPEGNPLMLVQQ